jgi:hypothetical protein
MKTVESEKQFVTGHELEAMCCFISFITCFDVETDPARPIVSFMT